MGDDFVDMSKEVHTGLLVVVVCGGCCCGVCGGCGGEVVDWGEKCKESKTCVRETFSFEHEDKGE